MFSSFWPRAVCGGASDCMEGDAAFRRSQTEHQKRDPLHSYIEQQLSLLQSTPTVTF